MNVDLSFDQVFFSLTATYAFAIPLFFFSILSGVLTDALQGGLGAKDRDGTPSAAFGPLACDAVIASQAGTSCS